MSPLKDIYNQSPRFLRNIYIQAFGFNNRRRYGKWNQLIRDLEYTETLGHQAQISFVDKKLKEILGFAIDNVPFYGKFSTLKKDFASHSAFDLLREMPITDKEFINKNPQAFVARGSSGYLTSRTSGTTGTPFLVHMDRDSFLLGEALGWRRATWAGQGPADWVTRLVGDPIIPLREKNPDKPWMISRLDRRIYLSTFHLNQQTAVRIGEFLNRRKPEFIMAYPSSLEILCGFLKASGFQMAWQPKMIFFSSEPMHAHQEALIREVMKTDIRGFYGSGEKLISAGQCNEGKYHLSLVDGFIEGQFGLMETQQPAPSTTLCNRVMPLIRYQIGDHVEPQPGLTCRCGRTLPIMSPVITKHEDFIITPSGRKIAPSAVVWAFIHEEIKDIKKGQVVQEDAHHVKVLLNTDEATFNRYRDVLRESMTKVFFGELEVEVVRTEKIEVSKAGKSRFILNKLAKGE